MENSRGQNRSVVADKNRALIMQDFLPKVSENFPTQPALDSSQQNIELGRAKERMNATLSQFSGHNKKVTPMESIAKRLASRQMGSEPYDGVFNSSAVMHQGKEFTLLTRSIPVSKTNNPRIENQKRGT